MSGPITVALNLIDLMAEPKEQQMQDFNSYRFYECIDSDTIERIVGDNNKQEIEWLKRLLNQGIWIRSPKGRRLKPDRFLAILEEM